MPKASGQLYQNESDLVRQQLLLWGKHIVHVDWEPVGVYEASLTATEVTCCATAWTKANISSGPCAMWSSIGTSV